MTIQQQAISDLRLVLAHRLLAGEDWLIDEYEELGYRLAELQKEGDLA
jgi:hypothetical protein